MLDQLAVSMTLLPEMLKDREAWDSLIVNRRKPYTYRVFSNLASGVRICLHKFDPCHRHEAFPHPHPWPGAFIIMLGSYRMKVGFSPDRFSLPGDVMELVMARYSRYEVTNPLTWHSITPLETTYTIMVNGDPWDLQTVAHKDVRTTAGKNLDKMPEDELLEHLGIFERLVADYNAYTA